MADLATNEPYWSAAEGIGADIARKTTKTRRQAPSTRLPTAPKPYRDFVARYPAPASAWDSINEAGADGPLDPRTRRLVKIAAAMGAMREGAVRSGARKALAEGIPLKELEQLVPLAAGTIGLPSAVACWSWVRDVAGRSSLQTATQEAR